MVDDNSSSLFDDNELRVSDSQGLRAVQESLLDMGPDEQAGYHVPIACQVAGISCRQLDCWTRTKLVELSTYTVEGLGTQRLYSFRDILVLKIIRGLLDTGISLRNIRLAIDHLRDLSVDGLTTIILVSDGRTAYRCRSNEGVIDLLNGGQGVFGITAPGIAKELTDTIASSPSERIDGTQENLGTSIDGLAERRRRRIS